MKETHLCMTLIYLSIYIVHGAAITSQCGRDNWVAFEDEKCFKLFTNFASRNQAEQICNQQDSTLVSIKSVAEQKFLIKYIFNSSDSNSVWIGARRRQNSSNEFEWDDGSTVQDFTNWAVGRPSNEVRRDCVQMHTILSMSNQSTSNSSDMEWSDVGCNIGNWFVCQKLPTWSFNYLQQAVLNTRRELTSTRNQLALTNTELNLTINQLALTNTELTSTINQLTLTNTELTSTRNQLALTNTVLTSTRNTLTAQATQLRVLEDNPIPIGFIYVQLPNQPEPQNLWGKVQWIEVTASYAGLFFRASGGGSESFGTTQLENSPRLSTVTRQTIVDSSVFQPINADGQWSVAISTGTLASTPVSHWGLRFLITSGEVRPRNTAVRIWRRTI